MTGKVVELARGKCRERGSIIKILSLMLQRLAMYRVNINFKE